MAFKLFITTACIGLLLAGCSSTKLISQSKQENILIDGVHTEWQNRMDYNEERNVSYGAMHDSSHFYFCLLIPGQDVQRQMLGLGFKLWLEGRDGDYALGIEYPVSGNGRYPFRQKGEAQENGRNADLPVPRLEGKTELVLYLSQEDMGNRMSLKEAGVEGIQVAVGSKNNLLVYECRVPLLKTEANPYGLFEKMPESLKIQLMVPEPEGKKANGMQMSMGGRGGMGGGRGGRGGGMGGRRGGMGGGGSRPGGPVQERPDLFKMNIQIDLNS